jgi:hypothetical protein
MFDNSKSLANYLLKIRKVRKEKGMGRRKRKRKLKKKLKRWS